METKINKIKSIAILVLGFLILFSFFYFSFLKEKPPKISERAKEYFLQNLWGPPPDTEKAFFQKYSLPIPITSKKFKEDLKKAQEILPFEILIPREKKYFAMSLLSFSGKEKGAEKFFGAFLTEKGAFGIFVDPGFSEIDPQSIFPQKPEELNFKGRKIYFWDFGESKLILFDTKEIEGKKYPYFLDSPELSKEELLKILEDILK
jgi:hypothetical protein